VADALSRKHKGKVKREIWAITVPLVKWIDELKVNYDDDPKVQTIF